MFPCNVVFLRLALLTFRNFHVCFKCCYFVYVSELLIILGDVEDNPGPQLTDRTELVNSMAALQILESRQADLLAQVISLQNDEKMFEGNVGNMSHGIAVL